ncbi:MULTISPECIES: MBL fold metallo-hydrolase [Stenotrophomonas]|uniref:Lactamase n=1 Tax=Stenotrophomonas nitritireducens TaxID=83617 RepID=A0ABR5NI94_9GAMM|nr:MULTISPECIES: MBL fold metallo-hydrolase [Stenotrophomonas]KRG56154.1 lactamase [Stenotrophomonas nitritireducens]
MKACIRRGSKQIGGSCIEVEQNGLRLLIDLGLPLDATENVAELIPAGLKLDGSDQSLLGILISHPHLDHYGLLAHVDGSIPVGLGAAARRILAAAIPFLPGTWPVPSAGWEYQSGQPIEIGPFTVTPYLVDHSAFDAYALLIEGGGDRLFYSGDFRGHGRKAALFERLIAAPPSNINALLVEGSSLTRLALDATFPTEAEIEAQLADEIAQTKGLALVHTSAQNIDRIVSIFRASRRCGRQVVMDLYAATILEATGNLNIPQSDWSDVKLYVPHRQRLQIKQGSLFELLKRHSKHRIFIEDLAEIPMKSTLLFRPLHQPDLERAKCLSGARYIYSQWEGYWDGGSYAQVAAFLARHDIPKVSIHTSGHASPVDLKRFVAAINPGKVVPIHSFRPDRYTELFECVEPQQDGQWWPVKSAG